MKRKNRLILIALCVIGISIFIFLLGIYKSIGRDVEINKVNSLSQCDKNIDVWRYLPKDIQQKTYKKEIISPGEATYDLYLLSWSEDCRFLSFLLELIGRGKGAYKSEDFEPRGLYLFDNNSKQIKLIKKNAPNSFISQSESESNYWINGKYIFTEIEEINGVQSQKNYIYNPVDNSLMSYDTQ